MNSKTQNIAVGPADYRNWAASQGLKKVLMPLRHDEFFIEFWNDVVGQDPADRTIRNFIIFQTQDTIGPYGFNLVTTEEPITADLLADVDVLYIQFPRKPYSDAEIAVIVDYVKNGGSLFLVMDQDHRSSTDRSNPVYGAMEKLVKFFDMGMSLDIHLVFWGNDILNHGAIAKKGVINKEDREIPAHGARHITGGIPFSYYMDDKGLTELVQGAYKEVEGGGRIIVLGEEMATLLVLGQGTGIRLQGDYGVPVAWWGKDSHIFVLECFQWLVSNKKKSNKKN
jgi:hypothetical protein